MDDIIKEFVQESTDNLDRLDRELVLLEKDVSNKELLASVFRTIHTIKGTAGFLGFSRLQAVAHAGESLLSRLRDGELTLNAEITSGLLAMVDAVRQMLATVIAEANDGQQDYTSLVSILTALCHGGKEKSPMPAAPAPAKEGGSSSASSRAEAADTSIRLDVGLLDQLINQMGELVLARNQILQVASTQRDPVFVNACQRLNLITTELREGVMKARMQPISHLFGKFPRVVRDLAVSCGKQVELEMEGGDTELDRTLLEAIRDPLTHLVRNAVDHGIETAEQRAKSGKPATGHLRLRAYHEGGQVNVEISDDGAGIDVGRVKSKALQRGLINSEQAARMSERDLLDLIFLPGFSTAEKVTNVSGRGVGMDVVKTNIDKIGGAVDIHAQAGGGTTVKIKIPLTLAIIPALIVTSGGDRYAIPQVSLVELVRVEGKEAEQAVERIHDAPVYRLRGTLLPLVYLARELAGTNEPLVRTAGEDLVLTIVVLQAEGRQFGLVVDAVREAEEIVVKPLGHFLKGISIFAGATTMGDGEVALILDVLGLAQRAHVVDSNSEMAKAAAAAAAQDQLHDHSSLLLFRIGTAGRMALPVAQISRLEEFPRSRIEWSNNRELIQYRDNIMPLVRVGGLLGHDSGGGETDQVQVLVCSDAGRPVGLVVDQILDIVDAQLALRSKEDSPHSCVSAVIAGQVTDLLDVRSLIAASGISSFESLGGD